MRHDHVHRPDAATRITPPATRLTRSRPCGSRAALGGGMAAKSGDRARRQDAKAGVILVDDARCSRSTYAARRVAAPR